MAEFTIAGSRMLQTTSVTPVIHRPTYICTCILNITCLWPVSIHMHLYISCFPLHYTLYNRLAWSYIARVTHIYYTVLTCVYTVYVGVCDCGREAGYSELYELGPVTWPGHTINTWSVSGLLHIISPVGGGGYVMSRLPSFISNYWHNM